MFLLDHFAYLMQAQAKHGDVYTLNLGVARWVILSHPRHIEQVLINNAANYRQVGPAWRLLKGLITNQLGVQEDFSCRHPQQLIPPRYPSPCLAGLSEVLTPVLLSRIKLLHRHAQSPCVLKLSIHHARADMAAADIDEPSAQATTGEIEARGCKTLVVYCGIAHPGAAENLSIAVRHARGDHPHSHNAST